MTQRYALRDLSMLSPGYEGRLLEEPVVERRIMDAFFGPLEYSAVRFSLSNLDGALTALYLSDLRGRRAALDRYDVETALTISEFTGVITTAALTDRALEIEASSLVLSVLEETVPKITVTPERWPNAIDLGAVVPVPFGLIPKVRAVYVHEDLVARVYKYVVAVGDVTILAVYRNGPEETLHTVYASEYTRTVETVDGVLCTVLTFVLRQHDFSGGLHTIYVDIDAGTTSRNFARAIESILSDTTWGLGQPVNAASFTAAAALLDSGVSGLFCDGAMQSQEQAQTWLRDLCMVRGIRLGVNAAGEWTIAVDGQQNVVRMTMQDGAGVGRRTLFDGATRTFVPLQDTVSRVRVHYRQNFINDEWLFEAKRPVEEPKGRELEIWHRFLRDHGSADRVAYYLGRRLWWNRETVEVELPQQARQLSEGELVELTYAPLGCDRQVFEVQAVRKSLTRIGAILQGWDPDIYTYAPSTSLPDDPDTLGTITDYTRVVPDAVTGLGIGDSGITQAIDGTWQAWAKLVFATPAVNYSHAVVQYRLSTETEWITASVEYGTGDVSVILDALLPGFDYDFRVIAVSPYSLTAASSPLSDVTMPGDVTPPDAPSAIEADQGGGRIVEVTITATPPADWAYTELWRGTTASVGAATKIKQAKALSFHDKKVAYGTKYWYWARLVDTHGNASAYSAAATVTPEKLVASDYGAGSVTTPTMAPGSVTSYIRQVMNAQVKSVTVVGPGWGVLYFTTGLGDYGAVAMGLSPATGNQDELLWVTARFDPTLAGVGVIPVVVAVMEARTVTVNVSLGYW